MKFLRLLLVLLSLASTAYSQGVRLNAYTTNTGGAFIQNSRIAFFGDSVMDDFDWPEKFFMSYPEFAGWFHTNMAHSGFTTTQMIPYVQQGTNWLARTSSNQTRIAAIYLGLNDLAKFTNGAGTWTNTLESETSMRTILGMITNVGATPLLATVYKLGYGEPINGYVRTYDIMLRSIYRDYGAILWDLYNEIDPAHLSDGTHPDSFNQVELRKSLYRVLHTGESLWNRATNGIVSVNGRVVINPLDGITNYFDYFTVNHTDGTPRFRVGVHPTAPEYTVLWAGAGAANPSLANWFVWNDGVNTIMQGASTLELGVGGVSMLMLDYIGEVSLFQNLRATGVYYKSNALSVATIKAGMTNGGSWVGMLSNTLQVVSMSNNVTSFKILYP